MIRTALALTVLSVVAFAAEAPLLSFVDPGAKVIGGMHIDRALASPLGRYLLAQINDDNAGFQKFVDQTGFDPRKDVREILMATSDTQRKHGFVVARGVFNGPRIIAAAQTHGAVIGAYQGVPTASSKTGQMIAVLDGSVALMGEESFVKYAIDHRAATSNPSFPLAQKAVTLANRYDGWMVASGVIVPPIGKKGTPIPAGAALQGILETSGGVEFGAVVRISGEALTRSDKDAQALVDVVRFMAAMIRNNTGNNQDLQRFESVLNSLEVKAEAATVKLSVSVPEADLEQWLKEKKSSTRASVR